MYRVHGQDDQMYEAASLAVLQQWVNEGRVIPSTVVDDLLSGTQGPASAVEGLSFARSEQGTATSVGAQSESNTAYPRPLPDAADIRMHWPLAKAIVATFCCTPIGLIAVVYAARVPEILARGDVPGARDAMRRANLWANISLIVGILYALLMLKYGKALGIPQFGP